ncbi:MAG TPA: hypothetical protein VHB99_10700 [Pirellulales bacterium]|nr:hypothetical protein [Pirellulales bacterium]
MQLAAYWSRIGNWLAFVLPAAGVCAFGFLAPNWYNRFLYERGDFATLGVLAGQFLWGAAWCALGPGRWIGRYLVAVVVGMAIAGAVLAGIDSIAVTEEERRDDQRDRATGREFTRRERACREVRQCALGFPLALLVCQFPFVWNRSYRGWRIVFGRRVPPPSEAELLRFRLSDALGATAGVALALAFWRLAMLETLQGTYGAEEALVASFFCVFLSLLAGTLALPIAPFVLGDRPRGFALLYAGAYLAGFEIVLTSALLLLDSSLRRFEGASMLLARWSAFALTALLMFWIAREIGYRFVRFKRA